MLYLDGSEGNVLFEIESESESEQDPFADISSSSDDST